MNTVAPKLFQCMLMPFQSRKPWGKLLFLIWLPDRLLLQLFT